MLQQRDLSGAKRNEFINTINNSCQQLLGIVNDIIDISKKEQEIIFGRLNQVKPDIAQNYGGAGLGLSIAKAFVEKKEVAVVNDVGSESLLSKPVL